MTTRELEIRINPDGSVEAATKGYKGGSCLEIARMLEQIVGTIQSENKTTEFYEPDTEVHNSIGRRVES